METLKAVMWPALGILFYVIFVILFQFGPGHFAEGARIQFNELTGKGRPTQSAPVEPPESKNK